MIVVVVVVRFVVFVVVLVFGTVNIVVVVGPRNLNLKLGHYRVSNSLDIIVLVVIFQFVCCC